MRSYTVGLDEDTARFYQKVADRAGLPVEQVLADALFRFAGELARRAADVVERGREESEPGAQ